MHREIVGRKSNSTLISRPPGTRTALQRKCACGGSMGRATECEDCKKKNLQRRADGGATPEFAPPVVHEVLRSSGQPLDASTRSFFESRFGHDFSKVRIHADDRAAESATAVGALAYTVGRHVAFASGQYAPHTSSGRLLIAHELAHAVQQGQHEPSSATLPIGDSADRHEQQADRLSSSIAGAPAQGHATRGTHNSFGAAPVQGGNAGTVLQRKIPTGISLKETHALGHGNLKNEDDKKKYLTYIADVSLMQLTPAGDYTDGQAKGECTKEFLTEVSNTCPAGPTPFCTGDKCFQVNQYRRPVGDGLTGTTIPDGPDTFVDFHRARFNTSLLAGSGKKQCSVVCHQLYKYRTAPDNQYHELGAFYIVRNFKADKFTPSGSTTPIDITTGEIRKVAAGSNAAPSKEEFAKSVAPGLVTSGTLLDAPPVPQAPPASTKREDKK